MKAFLRKPIAAALLLAPAATFLAASPVAAQQRATVAAPVIGGLSVNADEGVAPGSTLRFNLSARAGARRADVVLGKSGIVVPLRETRPGTYTGSYVVRRADRLDPTQLLAARVTHGETIARNFSYPPSFQQVAMGAAAAPAPAIERFVMRPMGRIEPGSELRLRLLGAPGGDAWADIPGVTNGIDLAEVRPGVYEGSYTVRRRDDPEAFRGAIGSLRSGSRTLTARLDPSGERAWDHERRDERPQARDDRPPQITELTPGNGERIGDRGRVHVGARLADEGSGIDPAGVRLRIGGRDVTGDARITGGEVQYRADLPPGRYSAEVSARDRAGNATTKSWTFDVVPTDRDRVGAGPLPLQITSHVDNGVIDGNSQLNLQGRTLPYATVRVQIDSVANVGGLLGVTTPVANQTVQADRNGNFSLAVMPTGLPLPGQRYDVHLTASSEGRQVEERITLLRRG